MHWEEDLDAHHIHNSCTFPLLTSGSSGILGFVFRNPAWHPPPLYCFTMFYYLLWKTLKRWLLLWPFKFPACIIRFWSWSPAELSLRRNMWLPLASGVHLTESGSFHWMHWCHSSKWMNPAGIVERTRIAFYQAGDPTFSPPTINRLTFCCACQQQGRCN